MVQEQCIQECAKHGVSIESAAAPGFFQNTSPHGVFVRQVAGAASEYEARIAVDQMRNGREAARAKSKAKTLTGKNKCEGRKNFLELFPDIKEVLLVKLHKPFCKLRTKDGTDMTWRKLSTYLLQRGIFTSKHKCAETGIVKKGKNAISPGRLMHWLRTLDGKRK